MPPESPAGESTVGDWIAWVVVPELVVKVAEVTVALPGHQARNRPLPTVVTTCEPSFKTKVAADTPGPVEPSAMV